MKLICSITICITLLFSCSSSSDNKQTTSSSETNATKNSVPVDMNNQGVGPFKNVTFSKEIDKNQAKLGEILFSQKCSICHMVDQSLVGPAMKGVFSRRNQNWVLNMIINPELMLKKDKIAQAVQKEYGGVKMLNLHLEENEVIAIAEYLRTL